MAHITCSRVISGPPQDVFTFACDPKNLPSLLSQHIEVELDAGAEELSSGVEYGFTMTRFGLSQKVRLRIVEVKPGQWLTYKQVEGLFAKWVHTMRFERHGEAGTLVTDMVEYELPFGLLGLLLDDLWVRGDMQKVLEDRLIALADVFDRREQRKIEEEGDVLIADSSESV